MKKLIWVYTIIIITSSCIKHKDPEFPDIVPLRPTGFKMASASEFANISPVELLDTSLFATMARPVSGTSSVQITDIGKYIAVPPPRAQKGGSCGSWSIGYGLMGFYNHIIEGTSYDNDNNLLSPSFLYNQISTCDTCGTTLPENIEFMNTNGISKWALMPGTTPFGIAPRPEAIDDALEKAEMISEWHNFTVFNINKIKTFLSKGYPIPFGAQIDYAFMYPSKYPESFKIDGNEYTYIKYSRPDKLGSHAMLICGFDDKKHAFNVLNSWGPDWGNNGFMWIDYDFFESIAARSFFTYEIYLVVPRPVITKPIRNVQITSADAEGLIILQESDPIVSRGFCFSPDPLPTVDGNKVVSGNGIGKFTAKLEGLLPKTKYYFRAYASTSTKTTYGNQKSFITSNGEAAISTNAITSITRTSASSGGLILNEGNAPVTQRGLCWSTEPNPTINNSKTIEGSGIGSFTSKISDLKESTLYYVRAYASDNLGNTFYGNELNFRTALVDLFQLYQGGVVVYIDSTGQHGLTMSRVDIAEIAVPWTNGDTTSVGTDEYNGALNTTKIISKLGNTGNYAAKLCRDFRGGGFDDWYLPSANEFRKMQYFADQVFHYDDILTPEMQLTDISNSLNLDGFWTSSEYNANNYFGYDGIVGGRYYFYSSTFIESLNNHVFVDYKTNRLPLRACRKF